MEDTWHTITSRKKAPTDDSRKKVPKVSSNSNRPLLNAPGAQVIGVASQTKAFATKNKQTVAPVNSTKLDKETDEFKHAKVSLGVGRTIMQARQAKGMSQKDLAVKIAEKQQLIADYESGRAIPNNNILNKLERQLEIKLRGKDIGKPLELHGAKKSVSNPALNKGSSTNNGGGKNKRK